MTAVSKKKKVNPKRAVDDKVHAEQRFWRQFNQAGLKRLSDNKGSADLESTWPLVCRRLAKLKTKEISKLIFIERKSSLTAFLTGATRHPTAERTVNRWLKDLYSKKVTAARHKSICKQLEEFAESPTVHDNSDVFYCLGAVHALPALLERLSIAQLAKLVLKLLEVSKLSNEASNLHASPWREQVLRIELPLAVSCVLPNVDCLNEMVQSAATQMSQTITACLDTDGWPGDEIVNVFGPLLASWRRSFSIIEDGEFPFDPEAEHQLEWAIRQLLRMLRPDRTLVMSGHLDNQSVSRSDVNWLLKISRDPDDRLLADHVFGKVSLSEDDRPPSSTLSEWSGSGLLASGWKCNSPKVAFEFNHDAFHFEFMAKRVLIAGDCSPCIRRNDRELKIEQGIQVVCEHSDDDLDYIEFETALDEETVLNRQLLLSRNQQFAIVNDVVRSANNASFEYRVNYPLAPGITPLEETETREVYLRDDKIRSLVLPLSLPEWKVGNSVGRMDATDNSLCLSMTHEGRGFVAPIFIDLNPRRSKKPRTWRRLTVVEDRQPVADDVATAFRVQIGKQQWLIYRAIADKGNRTFLGQNFIGEFLISRFDRDGNVTELLRIE